MPRTDAVGDELGDAILRSLRRILRKVSEISRSLSRTSGLTVPQYLCLRSIAQLGNESDVSVAQVSRDVQLAAPTVSRIVDRLERAGLVDRRRRSDDRRKVSLSLTAAGHERLVAVPAPLTERFERRLAELEPARGVEIHRALEQLVEMLEASDIDAAPLLMPGVDPTVEEAEGSAPATGT